VEIVGILIGGAAIFALSNFKIPFETCLPAGRQGLTQTERGLSGKSSSVNENLVS
jgi:hypothetical protein